MLNVRRVTEGDSEVIFEWRNDDVTRKMFRTSERVDWEGHSKWLVSTLNNPNHCLLMCESTNGDPIAVVRFDVRDSCAELSINLSPLERGKGLAPMCLSLAINYFEEQYPSVSELVAEVKTMNMPSRKSFEKVGFTLREENDGWLLKSYKGCLDRS